MVSAIGLLWSLLSVIVAGVCGFSFMQPFWIVHPGTLNALGLYRFCARDPAASPKAPTLPLLYGGGDTFSLGGLPSAGWRAACVLYGGGCAVLAVAAVCAVLAQCLPGHVSHRIAAVVGGAQGIAVVLLLLGVTLLPLGLTGRVVHQTCPRAHPYRPGVCQVGWAYLLAMIGTALASFSPFLAQYTDVSLLNRRREENRQLRASKTPDFVQIKPQPLPPPPPPQDFV